jgi:hypothetical protein
MIRQSDEPWRLPVSSSTAADQVCVFESRQSTSGERGGRSHVGIVVDKQSSKTAVRPDCGPSALIVMLPFTIAGGGHS